MLKYALALILVLAIVFVMGPAAVAGIAAVTGAVIAIHRVIMASRADGFEDYGGWGEYGPDAPTPGHLYMMEPHHSHISYDLPPVADAETAHAQGLSPETLARNDELLQRAYGNEPAFSYDDRIMSKSLINGRKQKEALDIRSHMNNNGWKKYWENELGYFDQEHRDWWTRDDVELSTKHVVF